MSLISKGKVILKCIKMVKNWQEPILLYLNLKNEKSLIEFKNGLKCYLRDKGDAIAFFENFFLDVNFPSKEFKINKEDTVIDIGAHVGYFTINVAEKASKGKIFSFEPNSSSFSQLEENITINKLQNVKAENFGVLNRTGKAELFSDEYSIGNSMYSKKSNSKESVNVISLKDILEKNNIEKINFLKLDCEGAEYDIILNLTKNELDKIQLISAEIHPNIENHSVNEIKDFLSDNGFSVDIQELDNEEGLSMLYARKI